MYNHLLKQQKYSEAGITVVTIAAMMILPYLIHLLPPVNGVQLGARLLPIFYAPFLAVVLFKLRIGVVASIIAPFLNFLLLGRPTFELSILLVVQILIFCLLADRAFRSWPRLVIIAPVAYLIALFVSSLLLIAWPLVPAPWSQYAISSAISGLPGILILLALNILVVRHLDKNRA